MRQLIRRRNTAIKLLQCTGKVPGGSAGRQASSDITSPLTMWWFLRHDAHGTHPTQAAFWLDWQQAGWMHEGLQPMHCSTLLNK